MTGRWASGAEVESEGDCSSGWVPRKGLTCDDAPQRLDQGIREGGVVWGREVLQHPQRLDLRMGCMWLVRQVTCLHVHCKGQH